MRLKSLEEIAKIKEGGLLLGQILAEVAAAVAPGVTTRELDALAERRILEVGGKPAFKGYKAGGKKGFPATLCTSVNEVVVHGIPNDTALKSGDIIGLDIGMEWPYKKGSKEKGLFTDTAITVPVGVIAQSAQQLLTRTQQSLYRAIATVGPGSAIADIGRAVEEYIRPFGYGIVVALVGHGVGHEVHEEPNIPNVWLKRFATEKLVPGMVIAIEPMINAGTYEVDIARDGWAILTRDGKNSAHFEHTVIITEDGAVVATRRPDEL
ncbi:MAG: type I methionyl aminopeptidase [Patescibacteria group bacterium]